MQNIWKFGKPLLDHGEGYTPFSTASVRDIKNWLKACFETGSKSVQLCLTLTAEVDKGAAF